MVPGDLAGLAEADLVDRDDPELVLCVVHQSGRQEARLLQLLGDVALVPVFSVHTLTLHQVADDLAAAIVRRLGPAEADGGAGRVHHLREGRRTRGVCRNKGSY